MIRPRMSVNSAAKRFMVGVKVRGFMKKKTEYSDEPMKIGKIVNVLPDPAELADMARTERATLTLTKATLDFFRKDTIFSLGIPLESR